MKISKKILSLVLTVALVASINWTYVGELWSMISSAAMQMVSGHTVSTSALQHELETITLSKFLKIDIENLDDVLVDVLDDFLDKEVDATEEDTTEEVVGEDGSNRKYKEGFDKHLINGTLGKGSKGVVGGHNFDSFKKVISDAGFDINDCIINIKKHTTIEGIYEIEYRIPARQYGANGELEIIPNQYRTIDYPKTVYDPGCISNEQMIEWGKEAMESGIIKGRKISGYASNGLKFEGYIDLLTEEITNFYPVLDIGE